MRRRIAYAVFGSSPRAVGRVGFRGRKATLQRRPRSRPRAPPLLLLPCAPPLYPLLLDGGRSPSWCQRWRLLAVRGDGPPEGAGGCEGGGDAQGDAARASSLEAEAERWRGGRLRPRSLPHGFARLSLKFFVAFAQKAKQSKRKKAAEQRSTSPFFLTHCFDTLYLSNICYGYPPTTLEGSVGRLHATTRQMWGGGVVSHVMCCKKPPFAAR